MKQLIVSIILLLSFTNSSAAIVVMPFWDASGKKYTTDNYVNEIQSQYPGTKPLLLIIVTRSFESSEFKSQMTTLNQLDAEALQLILVTGSTTSVKKHGYWLNAEDADALLEGGGSFLFLAISKGGEVCFSSQSALKKEQIITSNKSLVGTLHRCAARAPQQ